MEVGQKNDVVFDVYENNPLKDVERNWRSSCELGMKKLLRNMEIKKWNPPLPWNGNKNKLVDFIVKQWVSSSSLIGYKILIVANNKKATIVCLFQNLKVITKKLTQTVSMIDLSKIMEFNYHFYLKQVQNHIKELLRSMWWLNAAIITSARHCDKDTFLKALLAFHPVTGSDSTRSFAWKSKSKSLSLLSSNESLLF